MGAGPARRHETIRLGTSVGVVGVGEGYPDIDELQDVELNLPDTRSYQGDTSRLTMPHVTGLRDELTPGAQGTVPILFTAPDGSQVEGTVQVADWPGRPGGRYWTRADQLSCSCGEDPCNHRRQAVEVVSSAMNGRRIRSSVSEWEQRRGHARQTLAGDHAASVAAPRERPAPDGPSWADDDSHFQAAYDQARQRITDGESPIPYMRDNATGGLGARDGGRAFGVEIEFDFPREMSARERSDATAAIGRDLQAEGLTTTSQRQGYHSGARSGYRNWTFEADVSVAGEIVSPKMYDEPQTWEQLEKVCDIVRRHGGVASRSAGSHVSVSMADYDHTVENHESLVRGVRHHEDLLYRLGQNTERRRHRRSVYAGPQPAPPATGYGSVTNVARNNSRYYTVNLAHAQGRASDRAEYRLWDATLDPAAIQGQVNLSLGMTDAAFVDHSWGDATPIGSHYTRNRTQLGGQRGARLSGDAWTDDTKQVRQLADRMFWRSSNREQVAALYAATRWERPNPR